MIENIFDLKGKVALVTGGARGIGAMITEGLVESGVKVYISSRSADALVAFADKMNEKGECIPLPMDLSKLENIESLAADLNSKEEKLDILINNSGAATLNLSKISTTIRAIFLLREQTAQFETLPDLGRGIMAECH